MQLRSKAPLNSLFDSDQAPKNGSESENFSVLFTQKGERFSLVFRPDSAASFSELDHYWDGTVFATYHPRNRALILLPPGEKLDAPYSQLHYFLDFGHYGVRRFLAAPERASTPPIIATDKPTELILDLPSVGKAPSIRMQFIKIEGKLVLEELHQFAPDGRIKSRWKNIFTYRPTSLTELLETHVSSFTVHALKPDYHVAQIRHFQWIGGADSFADDVFSPMPVGVVHVTDQRISGQRLSYISDRGAVPLETLHAFAKDPAAIQKHEEEVNARSLRP